MGHFRLSKAAALPSSETWDTDAPDSQTALQQIGNRMGVLLSFTGVGASDYFLQSRTSEEINFATAERVPVFLVGAIEPAGSITPDKA
jgi:hypothetical protein